MSEVTLTSSGPPETVIADEPADDLDGDDDDFDVPSFLK